MQQNTFFLFVYMKLLALLNLLTVVWKKIFCRFLIQSVQVEDQKNFRP